MIVNHYLIRRLCISIIFLVLPLFIIIPAMWRNKTTRGEIVVHRYAWMKIVYTRILPCLLLVGSLWCTCLPILDMIDVPNVHTAKGVITRINFDRNKMFDDTYNIKIDGRIYQVPKNMVSKDALKKGDEYKIWYYKYSKLVYMIQHLSTTGNEY